jgi:hypothetical protein
VIEGLEDRRMDTMEDRPGRRHAGTVGLVAAAVVVVLMVVVVLTIARPTHRDTVTTTTTCTTRAPGGLTAVTATRTAPATTAPSFRDNDAGHARIPDEYNDADIDNRVVHRGCTD